MNALILDLLSLNAFPFVITYGMVFIYIYFFEQALPQYHLPELRGRQDL